MAIRAFPLDDDSIDHWSSSSFNYVCYFVEGKIIIHSQDVREFLYTIITLDITSKHCHHNPLAIKINFMLINNLQWSSYQKIKIKNLQWRLLAHKSSVFFHIEIILKKITISQFYSCVIAWASFNHTREGSICVSNSTLMFLSRSS